MKKLFFTLLLLFSLNAAFGQSARMSGSAVLNSNKGKAAPLGSPYSERMFASANVEKLNIKAYMRYNIVNDEFEFITQKNDTLILDKIEDFNTIKFPESKKKYILTPYVNRGKLVYGYLIEQYRKNDLGLFRKENISYIEAKVAKTSLETSMPSKYTKQSDSYFLKNGDHISEFPNGKKALVKLFPNRKQAIESFIKENKISFDEEKDQIKIIDFLAAE